MNKKNIQIEERLSKYIAREHFEEESEMKRSAALQANE